MIIPRYRFSYFFLNSYCGYSLEASRYSEALLMSTYNISFEMKKFGKSFQNYCQILLLNKSPGLITLTVLLRKVKSTEVLTLFCFASFSEG